MFLIKTINKIKTIQNIHLKWIKKIWEKEEDQRIQNKIFIKEFNDLYTRIEKIEQKLKQKENKKNEL